MTEILWWGVVMGLLVSLAAGVARFRKNPRLATASACLLLLLGVALAAEAATRLYHQRAHGIPFGATLLQFSDSELGWRGFEVMGDPLSPRAKILVVGDSFTTPDRYFVHAPEMYYTVLGRLLDAEVFAYGAGGYGTLQELMVVQRYLPRIRPDLVILQVANNDFINNSWELESASYFNNNLMFRPYWVNGTVEYKFPSARSGIRLSLGVHSRLAYEVTIGLQRLGAFLTKAGYLQTVEQQIWQQGLAFPPFQHAVAITDELIARMERRVAPTPLVVFQADYDDSGAFYASWRAVLRRHEVRFCEDVGSRVRAAELRGAVVRPPDNTHWNPAGHAIVARALAECVRSLLPGPPRQ